MSDTGGSDLSLMEVLGAGDATVPPGFRRKAQVTVVENVARDDAREVLEMLGIGADPQVLEKGESRG